MNVLLLLNSPHYLRPFASTVQTLAERGHQITVGWYTEANRGRESLADRAASHPNVRFITIPSKRSERSFEVGLVRRTRNYLHYLDEPFRGTTKLRRRAFTKLLRATLKDETVVDPAWSEAGLSMTRGDVARITKTLTWLETLIPPDPECTALIADGGYDAVLVSPLVDLSASGQADFVKAAQHLSVPVGLLVYSWDNLSTKGEVHVIPDKVFTWNRRQREEAIKLHHVPANRVVVAGAPRFDEFLACSSQIGRPHFLGAMGLDPARPVLTYVCSSAFVSGDELQFIQRWLKALRGPAAPETRNCNVIVRPHPDVPLVGKEVLGMKLDFSFDGSPVSLRRPFNDPLAVLVNAASLTPQGLYECLWHSEAVVGLNTSAEIEAGLLGRPVFSVLAGNAADGQQATLHFHYLLEAHDGFVEVAHSFEQHVEQLKALLTAPAEKRRARHRAVTKRAMNFVRPLGRSLPVSDLLADAIEREMQPRPHP
jgi:hypothetical protein